MSVKVAGFKSSELFQQIKEGVESLPAEERAGNAKKVRIPPKLRHFLFSTGARGDLWSSRILGTSSSGESNPTFVVVL